MRDNLNILFVDDHPLDVMIEEFELKREGLVFVSRTATNEPELMQALMEFRPDVVLCDYNMPGLSGLHAMQCSRRLRPATPVLMVSGAIAEYTAIECLNRCADWDPRCGAPLPMCCIDSSSRTASSGSPTTIR